MLRRVTKALTARAVARMSPEPVSEVFGLDRGQAIDRHYIEGFLAAQSTRIRGRVLEIADDAYSRRFGHGVTGVDVLHAVSDNPKATIVGDLQDEATLPAGSFDCILLPQTLQFIVDPAAALATCHRALKPGGAVLATVPGISQVSRYDMDRWGDFWRFTDLSARRLFANEFGEAQVTVRTHGCVGSACAFLHGLAAEELDAKLLEAVDPDYQVLITVVATVPAS